MSDLNEKELATWGFTSKLRRGFMTSIVSFMMVAIVFLYLRQEKKDKEKDALYERLIEARVDRRVDTIMKKPIADLKKAVAKTDTAAVKASSAADKVDSLSNQYIKNNMR